MKDYIRENPAIDAYAKISLNERLWYQIIDFTTASWAIDNF